MRSTAIASILAIALLASACGRSPEEARRELEQNKVPVSGQSLVESTKSADNADKAKLLVQAGVDPNAKQPNGMTALMSAAFNRQKDTVKLLLDKGADVNAVALGETALTLAVSTNDADIVKMLVAHGADVNHRNASGLTPLRVAKTTRRTAIAEILTKAGGTE